MRPPKNIEEGKNKRNPRISCEPGNYTREKVNASLATYAVDHNSLSERVWTRNERPVVAMRSSRFHRERRIRVTGTRFLRLPNVQYQFRGNFAKICRAIRNTGCLFRSWIFVGDLQHPWSFQRINILIVFRWYFVVTLKRESWKLH